MLMPETYNRLYNSIGNLNRLLAWGHARVIENLLELRPECPRMLSDKFGDERLIRNALMERGRQINMEQMVRAESDVAVAAASILARDGFLSGMKKLEEISGRELPKGASALVKSCAAEIFAQQGGEIFRKIAKLHFKTWNEISGQ
jgi:ribonuclease HIII